MKTKERRWTAALAVTAALLLGLCAGAVRWVDPFFHYHTPDPDAEVWFDQRAQSAGLLRTQSYETLFMGSSLAANYRPFWFDVFYDTSTVKVTFPNGGFREFGTALDYACSQQDVKRVIFGLDLNLLVRNPLEEPAQLPAYLYDDNPWNDSAYLLNKDALLRSAYTVWKRAAGETEAIQDAFLWDGSVYFSRELALGSYVRPETVSAPLPSDALLGACRENLREVTRWLEAYPDTHFIFFFSPYSILYWDKTERTGQRDAVLSALEEATEVLLRYDNAELQFFLSDFDTITDLDNYADHIHVAGRVTYAMAQAMPTGEYRLTAENRKEVLDALRQFVVNYDYDAIFDPQA